MAIKQIEHSITEPATPELIAEFHKRWHCNEKSDVVEAARAAGVAFATRQLAALTRFTDGSETITLEHVINYAISFSEGYYAGIMRLAVICPPRPRGI
jgi:hypothetical protein